MSITHRKVLSTSVSVMNWTVIVHTLEYLRRSMASSSHGTSVYFYSWSCVKALSYASPLVIVTACWNSVVPGTGQSSADSIFHKKACKKLRSLNFLCSHSSVSSFNDSAPMTHKYLRVMKMYSVVVINTRWPSCRKRLIKYVSLAEAERKKASFALHCSCKTAVCCGFSLCPQTNSSKAIKACIDEMWM